MTRTFPDQVHVYVNHIVEHIQDGSFYYIYRLSLYVPLNLLHISLSIPTQHWSCGMAIAIFYPVNFLSKYDIKSCPPYS